MARSPIDSLIDAMFARGDFKCTRCKKAPPCTCWDNRVTLSCIKCGRTKDVPDDPTDPKGTVKILMHCPDCSPNFDGPVPRYFDQNDAELFIT